MCVYGVGSLVRKTQAKRAWHQIDQKNKNKQAQELRIICLRQLRDEPLDPAQPALPAILKQGRCRCRRWRWAWARHGLVAGWGVPIRPWVPAAAAAGCPCDACSVNRSCLSLCACARGCGWGAWHECAHTHGVNVRTTRRRRRRKDGYTPHTRRKESVCSAEAPDSIQPNERTARALPDPDRCSPCALTPLKQMQPPPRPLLRWFPPIPQAVAVVEASPNRDGRLRMSAHTQRAWRAGESRKAKENRSSEPKGGQTKASAELL